MDFQIITNNPKVKTELEETCNVNYFEISYREILEKVRDMCHGGYKLLSHPLSGSVKPNETPYKSVMVSARKGNADSESIHIIENCMIAFDKFPDLGNKWTPSVLDDFQVIDFYLISGAVGSAI
ncbi:GrdX family protein [Hespellia stercorisuis]|uniref:GrdX protein n=1 Tax=Hespellia stercorisuis DSM 15480 TaxID=1121950 RepID=A0A1M6JD31_9FIRM|nr:GrdX family protein [Hespellia stercorisuis]SHJ44588.1 hypothetical protein SAMN02745243_00594 [Hespellia stercorisuis DSM 15480]